MGDAAAQHTAGAEPEVPRGAGPAAAATLRAGAQRSDAFAVNGRAATEAATR